MKEKLMPTKTVNLGQESYLKNSFLGNCFILHTCYIWDNSLFLSKHPHSRMFVLSPSVSGGKKGEKKLTSSEYFPFLLTRSFLVQSPSQKERLERLSMSIILLNSWHWWELTFKHSEVIYCPWKTVSWLGNAT